MPPPFGKLNLWIQPSLHIDAHTPRISKRLVLLLHVDVPVFRQRTDDLYFLAPVFVRSQEVVRSNFQKFQLDEREKSDSIVRPAFVQFALFRRHQVVGIFLLFVRLLFLRHRRLRRRGNNSNRLFQTLFVIIIIIIIFNNFVFVVVVRGDESFLLRHW